MDRTIETITCDTVGSLPSIQQLLAIPREKALRIIFSPSMLPLREQVGAKWKEELPDFNVGVHLVRPEINVSKLITEDEIVAHAAFFEQCAKDYKKLATHLIHALAAHFNETIDPENAMNTFGKYKRSRQTGVMGGWEYRLHGAHCGFKNSETGQAIEVYLITSLEFGVLEPSFFVGFINTTGSYQPLLVEMYENYADGHRILEKMVALGKFERIQSLIDGHDNIVVKHREKVE